MDLFKLSDHVVVVLKTFEGLEKLLTKPASSIEHLEQWKKALFTFLNNTK